MPHLLDADECAFEIANSVGDFALVKGKWTDSVANVRASNISSIMPGKMNLNIFNLHADTHYKLEIPERNEEEQTINIAGRHAWTCASNISCFPYRFAV
jgi:hypothetical protein